MSYLIELPDLENDACRAKLVKGMGHNLYGEAAWPNELLGVMPRIKKGSKLIFPTEFFFAVPDRVEEEESSIRDLTPSVVSYTKGGKQLLFGRATLYQFLARNKLLQVSDEIRKMSVSGTLGGRKQKLAENLMSEACNLIDSRDTATVHRPNGAIIDHCYQTPQRLEEVWERISQLEKIVRDTPAP